MPLIQNPPTNMNGHARSSSLQLQTQHAAHMRDEKATSYDEIRFDALKDDEGFDSDLDLENSVLQTARQKIISRPPVVPPRSDKRASKMLANVMLELQNLDGSMTKDRDTSSIAHETDDPHELYLSSEEDASLADDYEDSLLDFNPTDSKEQDAERERVPSSGGSSTKSQEVTARAVSFVLVRPQIVNILSSTPANPKHPVSASEPHAYKPYRPSVEPTRRPSPLKRYPNSLRRLSISSIASLTHSPTSASSGAATPSEPTAQPQRALRKSSRMANLSSLVTSSLPHSFLNTDPYASNDTQVPPPQFDDDAPSTPKTPTGIAAAAFKKGLTRGLNRARQPSLSSLSSAFNSARGASVVNLSQTASQPSEETAKESSHQRRKSVAAPSAPPRPQHPPHDGPLTYEDVMKSVIREPPPPKTSQSAQHSTKVRPIGILALGRRRSVKAA